MMDSCAIVKLTITGTMWLVLPYCHLKVSQDQDQQPRPRYQAGRKWRRSFPEQSVSQMVSNV